MKNYPFRKEGIENGKTDNYTNSKKIGIKGSINKFNKIKVLLLIITFFLIATPMYYLLSPEKIFMQHSKDMGVLSGKIILRSGNCMPTICDHPPCFSGCKSEGIETDILIRKTSYLKKIIAKTKSNKEGEYSIKLPVGIYSFYAIDDSLSTPNKEYRNLFRNLFTDQNACPVVIAKDQITNYIHEIDHSSW